MRLKQIVLIQILGKRLFHSLLLHFPNRRRGLLVGMLCSLLNDVSICLD